MTGPSDTPAAPSKRQILTASAIALAVASVVLVTVVLPAEYGRDPSGVGRALVGQSRTWAIATGRPAVTLTTFVDVAWNRPLYEHLGFRVLVEHEIGPELREVRAHEASIGLEPSTRCCMRLDLPDRPISTL